MRRAWLALLLTVGFAGAAACSSASAQPGGGPDGGDLAAEAGAGSDGGPGPFASQDDAARPDDAGKTDSRAAEGGPSGDILGTLASGACGIVQTELAQATPSLESNLLVFVAGETYDRASLSPGGQTLFDTANAGGSSTESEVLSYEVLRHCEGATLLKTETQIAYQPPDATGANTITDLSVEMPPMPSAASGPPSKRRSAPIRSSSSRRPPAGASSTAIRTPPSAASVPERRRGSPGPSKVAC